MDDPQKQCFRSQAGRVFLRIHEFMTVDNSHTKQSNQLVSGTRVENSVLNRFFFVFQHEF